MNRSSIFGLRCSPNDEHQGTPADPGLRVLFRCARRLITALKTGADDITLNECIRAYIRCAAAQGVSKERIRLALHYLFQEHGLLTLDTEDA